MFRRILVPVDGSPLGEQALPFALSVARRSGAEIHVVLVHVPDGYRDYIDAEDLELGARSQEQAYLDNLGRQLEAALPGKIETRLLEGIVPETLAQEVVARGIDLVVMNAHGWGYISRAITGSVSDYLMRHVNVPLLVMHAPPRGVQPSGDVNIRRILICLDGSELAETILGPAQALGQSWQPDYQLLRVVSPPQHVDVSGGQSKACHQAALEGIRKEAGTYLAGVVQQMKHRWPVVETQVTTNGNVAAAILQEAEVTNCDLIAISTHGRGGLSRLLLGSVADKVIRGSHAPVLVFRPES